MWGLGLHSWEQLMLATLFGAGLIAIAVAIASACVVILTRQENAQTKSEYEAYKLTVDGKVADAKREGIRAGEAAGNALIRAADLEKKAQELKAANLAFESAISPRLIEQLHTSEALAKFAGVRFVVVSPSDFEPKRMAGQIRFVLSQAKWERYDEPLSFKQFAFRDGITVHQMRNISKSDPVERAIAALIAILKENGIEATTGFPIPTLDENGLPAPQMPNTPSLPSVVVVEVGPKPLPPSLRINAGDRPGMWGNIAE